MESGVENGKFRGERYYRLTGACLQLPPLRRRREDVLLLVQYFLSKYARIFQRTEMTLSDQGMRLFVEHPWPGNIRQLENVIKRVVALDNEELGVADLRGSPVGLRLHHARVQSPSRNAASSTAPRQAQRRST